jgi:hypothetical protein
MHEIYNNIIKIMVVKSQVQIGKAPGTDRKTKNSQKKITGMR